MKNFKSKKIKLVMNILKDEIHGDVQSAFKKLTKDYTMTWVYRHPKTGKVFPQTRSNIKTELEKVYPIKGRHYDIKNIAEGKNVVMIELIESYPDPKTKKIYRTPLVIVLEIKGNKIYKGRHYCDPNLSYLYLSEKKIKRLFSDADPKLLLE